MRIGLSLFLIVLIPVVLPAKSALGQSPVDSATLRAADAIMTEVGSAKSEARLQLLARLEKLASTAGLSRPCWKVLDRMQAMALATIPPDQVAATTEALQTTMKAVIDAHAVELVGERKACLEAAAVQQSAPDSSPAESEQGRVSANPAGADSTAGGTEPGLCTLCQEGRCRRVPCGDDTFAGDDTVPIHDRLVVLLDRLNVASGAADEASLERLEAVFDKIRRNAGYDVNCLMAAGALKEVAGNALARIRAKDQAVKKKEPAEVLAAIILTKRFLNSCK